MTESVKAFWNVLRLTRGFSSLTSNSRLDILCYKNTKCVPLMSLSQDTRSAGSTKRGNYLLTKLLLLKISAGFGNLRRCGPLHSQFGQEDQSHPPKTVSKMHVWACGHIFEVDLTDMNPSVVCVCVNRCPTLTWKRRPSSPSSRRNWPFCQVKHAHTLELWQHVACMCLFEVCEACASSVLVSNQICAGLSNLRGQRSAQWSDPDHPSQFRPDQHGGAQCNTGLPAQYPQVHTHTHTHTHTHSDSSDA